MPCSSTNQEIMLLHTLAATLISTTVSFHVPPASSAAPSRADLLLCQAYASGRLRPPAALRGGGPIEMSPLARSVDRSRSPDLLGPRHRCVLARLRTPGVRLFPSYGLSMALIGLAILHADPGSGTRCADLSRIPRRCIRCASLCLPLRRQSLQDSGMGSEARRPRQDAPRSESVLPRDFDGSVLCSHGIAPALPSPIWRRWHGLPASPLRWLAAVAAFGLVVETVADHSKSMFKIALRKSGASPIVRRRPACGHCRVTPTTSAR